MLKIVAQRDAQVIHTEKLLAKSKGKVYCSNCKRPTKKHYDFCKVCGKRQLFLLDHVDEDVDDGSKLTKSELFALQHGGDLNHHEYAENNTENRSSSIVLDEIVSVKHSGRDDYNEDSTDAADDSKAGKNGDDDDTSVLTHESTEN